MKKVFLSILVLIFFQGMSFAENIPVQQGTVSLSDNNNIVVYQQKDKKFGAKNKDGKILIPAEYNKLIRLGTTSWIIQKGARFGIIDNNNKIILEPKYRHAERFLGKYVKLGNETNYGLYDENGKAVIEPKYSLIDIIDIDKFIVCKNYKYGVMSVNGVSLIPCEFEDIYMPQKNVFVIKYDGEWFKMEQIGSIPNVMQLTSKTNNDGKFKITDVFVNTGIATSYSLLTITDYSLKVVSSISPSYESTIDELMFSQGAETVSIFMKLTWLPQFPYTYAKKYYENVRTPNNGPLSDFRSKLLKKWR